MSRRHGRNARIYLGLASSTASAEPLQFISAFTNSFQSDKPEVTALGDSNKVYVAGLPDAQGSMTGFYDDATVQTYTAAVDGMPRKFYEYPDTVNSPNQYWFGTVLPDFSIDGSVGDAIKMSATWNAASSIQKVG
jgi:hypothetical protein